MRVFKTKVFQRWVKKIGIPDTALKVAIEEIKNNPKKYSIGGNLYKPRIALDRKGKRGGARTIVACKIEDKAVFLYGFVKSGKDNINGNEKEKFLEAAKVFFKMNKNTIENLLQVNELIEVE